MKRIALIFIAMMSFAAMQAAEGLTFGVKASGDLVNYWGEGSPKDVRLGYQFGGFVEYRFAGSKFAVAPEVVFSAQGGNDAKYITLSLPGQPIIAGASYHCNNINVPLLVKFYPSTSLSIDFGPEVGFNIYSKATGQGSEAGLGFVDKKTTIEMKDFTNSVSLGVAVGASYNFTEHWLAQLRYTLGVTNVYKEKAVPGRHSNLQIAVGYRF